MAMGPLCSNKCQLHTCVYIKKNYFLRHRLGGAEFSTWGYRFLCQDFQQQQKKKNIKELTRTKKWVACVVSDILKVATARQMWRLSFCEPLAEGKLLENCLLLTHTAQNPFVLAGLGAILIYSLSCKLLLACEILIY